MWAIVKIWLQDCCDIIQNRCHQQKNMFLGSWCTPKHLQPEAKLTNVSCTLKNRKAENILSN